MIESITLKHHNVNVVQLVWQNGQMTIPFLNGAYNVIPGNNDVVITHNKSQVIEPVTGRLIVTCLFGSNGDVTSAVLNAEGYEVIAINDDGFVKSYGVPSTGHTDDDDVGLHRTRIEEQFTRNHNG